jgi:murein L,D-transpeptidase YafK
MTPRQSLLVPTVLGLFSIVAGVLTLRFMPTPPRPPERVEFEAPALKSAFQSGSPAWRETRDAGFLQELRRYQAAQAEPPLVEEPAPVGVEEPIPVEEVAAAAPEPPTPEPEIALETAIPLPPARPSDLPSADEFPFPPARPVDLAALPPGQPAQSPVAAAPQTAAVAPEAVLRPAPDDAFTKEGEPRFQMGSPVFVRIFKQEGQLELWLRHNGRFALYRTYPVCKWSGRLGPKIREADYQSPEGFYSVSAKQLNPRSNYHRAFNVGYPNAFDRQRGRTGGLVMVHGACKSVGCFAMTDRGIDEIYGFVAAAISAGQREVPVHIFPFRMTESAIARETGGGWLAFVGAGGMPQWASFWRNLKEGYDIFEQTGEPPAAYACGDRYAFDANSQSCQRIAGW